MDWPFGQYALKLFSRDVPLKERCRRSPVSLTWTKPGVIASAVADAARFRSEVLPSKIDPEAVRHPQTRLNLLSCDIYHRPPNIPQVKSRLPPSLEASPPFLPPIVLKFQRSIPHPGIHLPPARSTPQTSASQEKTTSRRKKK